MKNHHTEIGEALEAELGLEKAATLKDLLESHDPAANSARFFVGTPEQRLATLVSGFFTLEADALIHDAALGTLGVVHLLIGEPEKTRERVQRWIDDATYLRHLLLENAALGQQGAREQACTVELVLTVPPEAVEQLAAVGEILRELMSQTSFLSAIGVNVWKLGAKDAVPRAFSWLLSAHRTWLAEQAATTQANVPPLRVRAVVVKDFRLAGERRLPLEQAPVLHLVHGSNGSGKSSLVEALELVMTGKVKRLGDADHHRVLTTRGIADAVATVALEMDGGAQDMSFVTQASGVAMPLAEGADPASFRLDQKFADEIAQGTPAERAVAILRAFFPQEQRKVRAVEESAAALDGALAQLALLRPGAEASFRTSGRLRPEALAEHGWIEEPLLAWEKVCLLAPLTVAEIDGLVPLLPESVQGEWRESVTLPFAEAAARAANIETALRAVPNAEPGLAHSIAQALALLEIYARESVAEQTTAAADLPRLMNEWLELVAMEDCLRAELEVARCTRLAQEGGYDFDDTPLQWRSLESPELNLDERAGFLETVRERILDLRGALAGRVSEPATPQTPASAPHRMLLPPSRAQTIALDEVARCGLLGAEYRDPHLALGETIRRAFEEHAVQSIALAGGKSLRVGEGDWGGGMLARLQTAHGGLVKLSGLPPPPAKHPAGSTWSAILETLLASVRAARAHALADSTVAQELAKLLSDGGTFSRAFNELLALFTPARWAYEGLQTHASFDEAGGHQMSIETDDKVAAHLRLNTAELNTLALSVFLLCARGAPNPLRLLVLDDPLQNMDELTVTTLARGLARLLRLWSVAENAPVEKAAPWRVLLLLHGEEDVERFRREVPCTVCFLPWLAPLSAAPAVAKVRVEKSCLADSTQSLQRVISAG